MSLSEPLDIELADAVPSDSADSFDEAADRERMEEAFEEDLAEAFDWAQTVEISARYALRQTKAYEVLRTLPLSDPAACLGILEQMLAEDRRHGYLWMVALRNPRHAGLVRALVLTALKVLRASRHTLETFRIGSQRSLDQAARCCCREVTRPADSGDHRPPKLIDPSRIRMDSSPPRSLVALVPWRAAAVA
jgi:hypothetical protein